MRIVVLTGAGVSAESGVPTFRDADGLWEGHRVEDVATPEGYDADPALVHAFYDARRAALREVAPNPAHLALGRLESVLGDDLTIVTQNVDDLHERGGAQHVVHMHGELLSALCRACGHRYRWSGDLGDRPACPGCGVSELRPDIVWFGEMPYEMDRISQALAAADLFVSIGTSGAVYPAAGFVIEARARGIRSLELNLEPSEGTHWFDEARHGKAGDLVPRWVDQVLESIGH
ncbi:NAD-dependent deacylase [Nocardioides jejuensis]|uniref:NAD-dependent protein deacylase n=1 Tax=Nocardioides jejuensis TaxID=2502782 RepID=A0A4V2NXZ7_9ACTN|nr:NAD-dependent deacylase [Nocardioides jejuensis]TCJ23182.1 NAD-dependent deacylase [Nocardioides jejuensis]